MPANKRKFAMVPSNTLLLVCLCHLQLAGTQPNYLWTKIRTHTSNLDECDITLMMYMVSLIQVGNMVQRSLVAIQMTVYTLLDEV